MVSLICEQTLPLRALAKMVPGNCGKPLHYETLRRWSRQGVQGVKLESKKLGGKRVSSLEAVDRFMEQLTAREVAAEEVAIAPRMSAAEQAIRNRCLDIRNY
jgi:hypothetical protein